MSDSGSKTTNRTFKKRAHRPWQTELLEDAIETAVQVNDEQEEITLDLDLNLPSSEDLDSFYPEFNFTQDLAPDNSSTQDLDAIAIQVSEANLDLKQKILQTKQQQQQLMREINDKSSSAILLGGFFQPQQLSSQSETKSGRKISSLLSDLKTREQKINSLTNNLKITQAIERAEQAELTKIAESQGRQAAEHRMRQAIEQAQLAADQFRTAMDRANQAAFAQQEEERLRKSAEIQANEAKLRANNAEIELQNERLARLAAEERAQHAIVLAEKAQVMQRELHTANAQLGKFAGMQQQLEEVTNLFHKIEQEHRKCSANIYQLETQVRELNQLNETNQQKINELTAQRQKIKSIVTTEQNLRKLAEGKLQEVIDRAEKAEKALQAAENQCKVIEDRAKRAIANANNTVLHLLNAPIDNEFNKPTEKASTAPQQTTQTALQYEYEADDLNL